MPALHRLHALHWGRTARHSARSARRSLGRHFTALIIRATVLALLLQLGLPAGISPARASGSPPPLPVQVVEPGEAGGGRPSEPPVPIFDVEPGALLVTLDAPPGPPQLPQANPYPRNPVTTPLPVGLTLEVPVQAAEGELVTYTVSLANTGDLPVLGLELQAFLAPAAHWAGDPPGQGGEHWNYHAEARAVTVTLPALLPHTTLTRAFATRLAGVPEGESLRQFVSIVQPGAGVVVSATGAVSVTNPVATATADASGGTLVAANGRVRVDVPPGALTTSARLEQHWQFVGDMRPSHPGRFFVVDLNAYDAVSGQPIHDFAVPVTLTLDVHDLLPAGGSLVLQYRNAQTGLWETASGALTPDPATGLVQVPISHFSAWAGGDPEKEGWKLLFNDASVGLFNGSISYSYPIDLPPGRLGLQPQVALNYNSSRVNGQQTYVQSDWAGLGWSLDGIEITRGLGFGSAIGGHDNYNHESGDESHWTYNTTYAQKCAHHNDLCFSDDFTLLFHGTGYSLVQDLSDPTLYHTEDESFLKVRRVSCPSLCTTPPNPLTLREISNQGGHFRSASTVYDYWEVTGTDGTVYRLGARQDSEQRLDQVCLSYGNYDPVQNSTWHDCGDDAADGLGTVVWRWRVDLVTDAYGNQMGYKYLETQAPNQGYGISGRGDWDRESYLDYVGYTWRDDLTPGGGWGYRVVFDRLCRYNAPTGCGTHETTAINDAGTDYGDSARTLWFQRQLLSGIRVLQMTSPSVGTIIREVRPAYSTSGTRGTNGLYSRVLASVTPYGKGGYGVSGALPATSFSYVAKRNYSDCHPAWPAYEYGRLSTIQNGYGATISLGYRTDNWDACHDPDGNNIPYRLNWWVQDKTVTDGLTPALYSGYDYGTKCYAQSGVDFGCTGSQDNSLTGFSIVTETVRSGSSSGPILARSEHHFFPDKSAGDWDGGGADFGQRLGALIGRETLTRQLNGTNGVLATAQSVYSTTVTVDRTDTNVNTGRPAHDALFVQASEAIQSQYDSAGTGVLKVQTRTSTAYGNVLTTYGQPVAQYSYGATRALVNGSFEQGGAGLSGWNAFNNFGGASFQYSVSPGAGLVGAGGLSLTHTGAGNCQCGVSQSVTAGISTGTAYRVFARVRTTAGTPQFRIWVSDGTNDSPFNPAAPGGAWTFVSQDFTPQASAQLLIMLSLESGTGASQTVQIDDVWFEPVASIGDEQTSLSSYGNADLGRYIVGQPIKQEVYTGLLGGTSPSGTPAARRTLLYDTNGALTGQGGWASISPATVYTTTYTYGALGNRITATDARNHTTYTYYDPYYRTYPMTVTNALAQTSFVRYDFGLGQVLTYTNANNVATSLQYDSFGRLVKVIADGDSATNPTVQYSYADNYSYGGLTGLRRETLQREASGTGQVRPLYEFYTGRGLLVQTRSEITPTGGTVQSVVNVSYDALGRALKQYVAVPSTSYNVNYVTPDTSVANSQTSYDFLGRAVTLIGTDGTQTTTSYDGLSTTGVDANGHQKISTVDAYGRLAQVQEYTGVAPNATLYATTRYVYDTLGNLTQVTDGMGQVTSMAYDRLGRKSQMVDASMGTWYYTYDENGNLVSQRDPRGAAPATRICFAYDALNRLLGKAYAVGLDVNCPTSGFDESYTYDQNDNAHGYGIGQRTRTSNSAVTADWQYDRRGRAVAETRAIAGVAGVGGGGTYTWRYGYNTMGQVITTTYPTGETITNDYDEGEQAYALTSPWRTYVSSATYNARGQMLARNNNTLVTSYSYWGDNAGAPLGEKSFRLKQLTAGSSAVLQLSYAYDAVGNVTSLTDASNAGQVQSFTYDSLDRLATAGTSAVGSGQYAHTGANAYSYDLLGTPTSLAGRSLVVDAVHPQQVLYSYALNGGRYDPFTTSPVGTGWGLSTCTNCTVPYTDGSETDLRHGGAASTTAYRTDVTLGAGDMIQVEFKLSQAAADATFQVETNDGPQNTFGLVAVPGNANLQARYKVAGAVTVASLSPGAFAPLADTWYVLRLQVGDGTPTNKHKLTVWKRDDPAQRASFEMNAGAWTGQSWRFRSWANTQGTSTTTVYHDNYFEIQSGGGVYAYRYDLDGNMLARTENSVGYSQSWDANNQLVAVSYGLTSTLSSYTTRYDPDGGRVLQVAPGVNGTGGSYPTTYVGGGLYEETITPTVLFADSFASNANAWTVKTGSWSWNASKYYQQTSALPGESAGVITSAPTYADITATLRVKIDGASNTTRAGLVLRRATSGTPGYFLALRNGSSGCGIYKKSGSTWTNMTPNLATCQVATGVWNTLGVRGIGGRLELLLNGVVLATWVDTSPLAAGGIGVQTLDGPASFDDVNVWGAASRSYYVFGGQRVALRQTTHLLTGSAGVVSYLHGDHLGSVSVATTAGGAVVGTRSYYYPFGEMRVTGTSPTDFAFDGERLTASLGSLYQMGARWYDGKLARWSSADTIVPGFSNPQSLNRYSYAFNNPTKYTDGNGHWPDPFPSVQDFRTMVNDVRLAVDAYNAGERNPAILWLDASGGTRQLVAAKEAVDQWNEDTSIVFSNAPLEQRFPRAVRVGIEGTLIAATLVGGAELAGGLVNGELAGGLAELDTADAVGGATADLAPSSAENALNLRRSLASQEQLGEALGGEGEVIAGKGTSTPIKDIARLLSEYGGEEGDWMKMTTGNYRPVDGQPFAIHWYQNDALGFIGEWKTKIGP